MQKANIGIITVGHKLYFEQFAGLKAELMQKAVKFEKYIDKEKSVLINFGVIDCVEERFESVKAMKRADLDLLFIVLSTYVPSAVCAAFAKYLNIPQILVGIQPLTHLDYSHTTTYLQLANDDICAMPEIAGVYKRLGRSVPPCIVASSSQTDYIKREINEWTQAVSAYAAFKYSVVGYLGHTYEGMYDMHTDPTAFTKTFGAHVKMIEMCDLLAISEKVTSAEIGEMIAKIKREFEICDPSYDPITDYIKDEDLELSARLAVALEKIVRDNDLAALAYYYKGLHNEYEKIAANLIIGNTFLTSENIPLAGEADLKTAAAMLIMNRIGGGGTFAEIHPFDTESNIVLIGHDGPHNIQLADRKPFLRKLKKYHGKSGSGIGVEFSLKKGPITMLSMNVDEKNDFKMVAATGISIAGEIPQTGNTNTKVDFGVPIHEFLSRWCEAGPTHHVALGCGDHTETLKKFACISGIGLTLIQ